MKQFLSLLLGSAFLLSPAYAQDTQPAPKKYANDRKLFEGFDHNKDGVIADFEFMKDMKARFKARDADGDGKVTRYENMRYFYLDHIKDQYGPFQKMNLPPEHLIIKYEAIFDSEDLNKDDVITEYENMLYNRELFKKVDVNKDGVVTWDESIEFLKTLK